MFSAKDVSGLKVVTASRENTDANDLRKLGDFLRDKNPNTVAALGSVNGEKVTLLAVCGKNAIARGIKAGDIIKADTFKKGDFVDVTGTTKGHGYQGVIKRWGAQRTPMSHGGGPVHRHAGSMGSTTDPSRIFKGKIGAGQMGCDQVTIQNLDVVKVDPELNLIAVRGAVPGPKGGLVLIKTTVKVHRVKNVESGISHNPQKASGRNPQKASARTK